MDRVDFGHGCGLARRAGWHQGRYGQPLRLPLTTATATATAVQFSVDYLAHDTAEGQRWELPAALDDALVRASLVPGGWPPSPTASRCSARRRRRPLPGSSCRHCWPPAVMIDHRSVASVMGHFQQDGAQRNPAALLRDNAE